MKWLALINITHRIPPTSIVASAEFEREVATETNLRHAVLKHDEITHVTDVWVTIQVRDCDVGAH